MNLKKNNELIRELKKKKHVLLKFKSQCKRRKTIQTNVIVKIGGLINLKIMEQ